jgi:hypothetical protein
LNLLFSCFNFSSAGITGIYHHTQPLLGVFAVQLPLSQRSNASWEAVGRLGSQPRRHLSNRSGPGNNCPGIGVDLGNAGGCSISCSCSSNAMKASSQTDLPSPGRCIHTTPPRTAAPDDNVPWEEREETLTRCQETSPVANFDYYVLNSRTIFISVVPHPLHKISLNLVWV